MGTHPIFESDFDCLTDCNSDNSICHQSLIQPLSSKSFSVLLVEKLVPPHHWLQRSVHSVSPQRGSVTISAKLLVTGRTQNHSQAYHSKQTGSGLCCSICLFYDHQGPQRTTT